MIFIIFLLTATFTSKLYSVDTMSNDSESRIQSISGMASTASNMAETLLLQPVSTTDPGTALAQVLIQQQAARVGISSSDMQSLSVIKPIFLFFQNLPANFIYGQKNWDFNKPSLDIIQQTMNPKTNDVASVVNLSCDLQFAGHGDINAPIGFQKNNGNYYFTPGQNIFKVQTNNGASASVKNLLDTNFRNNVINFVSLLGMTGVNIASVTGSIANFFDRAAILYPQDIFTLKLITLLNAAARNSSQGFGYPRIAHIPLETMMLLLRLSKTPNYNLTMQNHNPKPRYAYQWTPSKVIFFNNPIEALRSSFININDAFFQSVMESINVNVSTDEWQTYRSSLSPKTNDNSLNNLVANVWKSEKYNDRSNKILNDFLQNSNFVSYSDVEQKLFINTIAYHISQRNTGFLLYSQLYQQAQTNSSLSSDQINALVTQNATTGLAAMSGIDISLILSIFNSRTPKIIQIINNVISILSNVSTNTFLESATGYFKDQLKSIDDEKNSFIATINQISELKDQASDTSLPSSAQITAQNNLQKAMSELTDKISKLEKSTTPNLNPGVMTSQSVSLQDYLSIKFNDLMLAQNKKFRGDSGYFNNPLPVEGTQATNEALSIVLRSVSDLDLASSKFRVDPKSYSMYDLNGSIVVVNGPEMYSQTIAVKEKLNAAVQKKLYDDKQKVIKTGIIIPNQKLTDASSRINDATNFLQKKWLNFCLQYPFERIKKDPLLDQINSQSTSISNISQAVSTIMGDAGGNAILDSLGTNYRSLVGDEATSKNLDSISVIKNNSFYGKNSGLLIAKMITLNYLNQLNAIISNNDFLSFKQNELTMRKESVAQNKTSMTNLNLEIDRINKIITNLKIDETINSTQIKSNNLNLQTLMSEKTNLEELINNGELKVIIVENQITDINLFKTWISTTINNITKMSTQPSDLKAKLELNKTSPSLIANDLISRITSSTNLQFIEILAADINAGKNSSFTNVMTSFKITGDNLLQISSNDNETTLTLNLKSSINSNINNLYLPENIISKLPAIELISTQEELNTILALPESLNTPLAGITSAITKLKNPTLQIQPTPATNNTDSSIPPQFGTYDPEYPKTVLRFLAEEFCDLSLKSTTFKNYGSAITDTILKSLFGYNLNSLLTIMKTKQMSIMQRELAELATYSSTTGPDSLIPQEILIKLQSKNAVSEVSSMNSSLSGISTSSLSEAPMISLTTSTQINSATGTAIDLASGINVSINTANQVMPQDTITPAAIIEPEQPTNTTIDEAVTQIS